MTPMEAWSPPKGYRMVLDVLRGGHVSGFDRSRTYSFLRYGQDTPSVFSISECGDAFNVANLWFRELPESIRPC